MNDSNDLINYELCFPGAITGRVEVECPYCKRLLTVIVDDPIREDAYQCTHCEGIFDIDWANQSMNTRTIVDLTIQIEVEGD